MIKTCRRGHEYTVGDGCKECRAITAAARRDDLRAALAAPVRSAPPPAVSPAQSFMLTPEQLAAERDAFLERKAKRITATLEDVRRWRSQEEDDFFTAGKSRRPLNQQFKRERVA